MTTAYHTKHRYNQYKEVVGKGLKTEIKAILSTHFDPLSAWASPKKVHERQLACLNEIMALIEGASNESSKL